MSSAPKTGPEPVPSCPRFHPVVMLPPWAQLLDLRVPLLDQVPPPAPWSIGRYDEDRAIYDQPLFGGQRTIHVGIDLGAPVGTAVHAFSAGVVLFSGINPAPGDYGGTIVTEHVVDEQPLWALHGHLSHRSVMLAPPGRSLDWGEVIGWLGGQAENGGWPPHVHFQLSRQRPQTHDLPGAVSLAERDDALQRYPDPRQILGPVY